MMVPVNVNLCRPKKERGKLTTFLLDTKKRCHLVSLRPTMSSPSPPASATPKLANTRYALDSFSPYLNDDKDEAHITPSAPSQRPQPRSSIYRSVSWILGFKEKYSLLLCFIFGGAQVGFCLARSIAMNPSKTESTIAPGEFFWFRQPMYKINLFIHIYLTTIGGIGAILQFLPALRRRKMVLHRLNGYGVLFTLIVGNISGSIIARRSFGGELNVQSAYYILGIMIVFSGFMGFYYVKRDTRQHRKWMLRMVVYFSVAITARLIAIASRKIITIIGTYYSVSLFSYHVGVNFISKCRYGDATNFST
ncbi:hypothetical protein C8J57DRAFT_124012 [Mycena rebaudengoi]|nr:hypothetical protein C8J57DRAFT_124012 [Mycena rebaudengoi]